MIAGQQSVSRNNRETGGRQAGSPPNAQLTAFADVVCFRRSTRSALTGASSGSPDTTQKVLMNSELSPLLDRVVIRPIALDDADGLNATCWSDRPRDVVIDLLRRAQRLAEQRRGLAITALQENQPCAFAMLTLWPHCAEISDLIVSEPLRGRRIGTGLIEHLANAARGLGATMLEIGAALSNPRAIELYRRLGFRDGRVVTLELASGPEPVLYLYRPMLPLNYCQPVASPR